MRGSALAASALVIAALAAACGGNNSPGPTSDLTPAVPATTSEPTAFVLAEGNFRLAAAESFGDPGFHESILITDLVPDNIGSTAGQLLVVELRDVTRPRQACSQEHPLSGCATVDWSDSESRPNVPPGGVFDNRITLHLASGPFILFLSESGALEAAADSFSPG